jgi:hypothetical protein
MSQRRRNIRTQTEQELAELEASEQTQGSGLRPAPGEAKDDRPATPTVTQISPPQAEEGRQDSRAHLVKHRAARAENEEEQFDSVYKRETYYIDRAYAPRLKKLIETTKRTKTDLMNEALEAIFKKYGIE